MPDSTVARPTWGSNTMFWRDWSPGKSRGSLLYESIFTPISVGLSAAGADWVDPHPEQTMATRTAKPRRSKAPSRTASRPTGAERQAAGKALRDKFPRTSHGEWAPAARRIDPVAQIISSSKGRLPELIPIRYGRMLASPFTFYRGTANIMAADLGTTPATDIPVQACGDCHLLNFGVFATPERGTIFDINDFDETMPGPWEWDVKRLAASMVLAARSNGFSAADQRDAAEASVRSYREHMAEYAEMRAMEVWYSRIDSETLAASFTDKVGVARFRKRLAKATSRSAAVDDFPKMAEAKDGRHVIKDNPPLIYHHQMLDTPEMRSNIETAFADYRKTLPDDRRVLLDRYRAADFALKVVGVGSVGTLCAVFLLMAADDDPLFLQVKEARRSVLAPFVAKGRYANDGQRIVEGQRLMQAASDIFLGWTRGKSGRDFYLRQLRDVKLKPMVEIFSRSTMAEYGAVCGWTVARAHARSGDPGMIAGYLGSKEVFDKAVATFAVAYADQAERDHAAMAAAVRKGRIEVVLER